MQIGYCGNVHPGRTIEEVKQNLTKYSLDVKSQFRPDDPMGIGLWLSATAASELADPSQLQAFRDWLQSAGLIPYTLNGFPYGDFHQTVVKHDVYRPTWAESDRLDYTVRLAEILDVLLPPGIDGTISTLPLGWPVDGQKSNIDDPSFLPAAAGNLAECAQRLDHLSQKSGRNIFLCIEPEPGCILDTCNDVIEFFNQYLLTQDTSTNLMIRNHIGVCHDVCHSSVMFEEQSEAINAYSSHQIKVGKVQVSAAVSVNFDDFAEEQRDTIRTQLAGFNEPKYLHQTSVRIGTETTFYEDLGIALDAHPTRPCGQWRVHFHVPIFSHQLGLIGTTQSDIQTCLDAIRSSGQPTPHFEIETYAWNVLPDHLHSGSLADGISKELLWFDELLSQR